MPDITRSTSSARVTDERDTDGLGSELEPESEANSAPEIRLETAFAPVPGIVAHAETDLESELATAPTEELLAMQRLLARELLIFLAFLLLSMAAILFAFDRMFAASRTDAVRAAIIPIAALAYSMFTLIWTQRTLVGAGALLRIDDQLEGRSLGSGRPHRRFLSRHKADESDPPLEYLMMFLFSFLMTASSMVASYIAFNSGRFRARLAAIPNPQGYTVQAFAVVLTLAVFVAVFWWGWKMMRGWAIERYRARTSE
jgi:hypothetical protein